jgi:hypothetical protein
MAYKTVNGKLVKVTAVKQINKKAFTEVLEKMATILIEQEPGIGYDSTKNMRDVTSATILAYNLKDSELQDLLVYREEFEAVLDKQHNIKRSTGMMAMAQDIGAVYKMKNVPQVWQVMSGLLDSIIGTIYHKTQMEAV